MNYTEIYTQLHETAGGKFFPGSTIKRYANDIATLIQMQNPRHLLDYGSGKGYQYLVLRVHERWGGLLPYCYDVGVRQLASRPEMKFDGVICTDMLEHIEKPDVSGILDDILGFLISDNHPRFAFLSISCRPDNKSGTKLKKKPAKGSTKTKKLLPDDKDLHVTIEPPGWWILQIHQAIERISLSQATLLKVHAAFELKDGSIVREALL